MIRGSFEETLEDPGGQIDSALPTSLEVIPTEKKPRKNKEISLVTAEDLECLTFRFTTDNLTEEESLLHLFLLTCDRGNCDELICNHGTYKATNPKCHKILDETEMFTRYIDFMAPLNFLCLKCLEKSNIGSELFFRKSSLKHIREDFRANDLIVCEKHIRSDVICRMKESAHVQV